MSLRRALRCRCYISPGCAKGWHCEVCLSTPLLHADFWRDLWRALWRTSP